MAPARFGEVWSWQRIDSESTVDQPQCTKSCVGSLAHCYSAIRRAYKIRLAQCRSKIDQRLPILSRNKILAQIADAVLVGTQSRL